MSIADVKIQVRFDTQEAWSLANPVLSAGELGVETDTSRIKAGDGQRTWSQLPYVGEEFASALDGGSFAGETPPEPAVVVAAPPEPTTAFGGEATFSISASATDNASVSYQWQKQPDGVGEFVDIEGATGPVLQLTGLTEDDDGDLIRVLVRADGASEPFISTPVTLTVSSDPPPPPPPVQLSATASGPASLGQLASPTITLTATAEGGTGEYSYAWTLEYLDMSLGAPGVWRDVASTFVTFPLDQANLVPQGGSLFASDYRAKCTVSSGDQQVTTGYVFFTVVNDRPLLPVFQWGVADPNYGRAAALVGGLRPYVRDDGVLGNFPAPRNLDPDNANYCAFSIGDGMFICLPARADFTLPVLRKGFVGTGAVYQNTGVSASGVSAVGASGGATYTDNLQVQVFRQGQVVVICKLPWMQFDAYCLLSSDGGRTFKQAPFDATEIRNVAIGRSTTNGQEILVALFRDLGGLGSSVKWTADLQNFDGWQDPGSFAETPPTDGMYLASFNEGFLLETQSRFNSFTDEEQYFSPAGRL